jgi:hypothetical protein
MKTFFPWKLVTLFLLILIPQRPALAVDWDQMEWGDNFSDSVDDTYAAWRDQLPDGMTPEKFKEWMRREAAEALGENADQATYLGDEAYQEYQRFVDENRERWKQLDLDDAAKKVEWENFMRKAKTLGKAFLVALAIIAVEEGVERTTGYDLSLDPFDYTRENILYRAPTSSPVPTPAQEQCEAELAEKTSAFDGALAEVRTYQNQVLTDHCTATYWPSAIDIYGPTLNEPDLSYSPTTEGGCSNLVEEDRYVFEDLVHELFATTRAFEEAKLRCWEIGVGLELSTPHWWTSISTTTTATPTPTPTAVSLSGTGVAATPTPAPAEISRSDAEVAPTPSPEPVEMSRSEMESTGYAE